MENASCLRTGRYLTSRNDVRNSRLLCILPLTLLLFLSGCATRCEIPLSAQNEIAARRLLAFEEDVACSVLPQSRVQDYLRRSIEKRNDLERLHNEGLAFQLLGLLPESYRYPDAVVGQYAGELLALYSPEDRSMIYVRRRDERRSEAFRVAVMKHELVHALQDQHFQVERFLVQDDGNDAILARMALLEGDAMFASSVDGELSRCKLARPLELYRRLSRAEDSNETMPRVIRYMMEFPYIFGEQFVCALYREGGWDAVNKSYLRLPRSTMEIVEPKQYLSRIAGKDVVREARAELCDSAYPHQDELGQFMGFTYLRLGNDTTESVLPLDGWQRDFLFFSKESMRLCWEIQFDGDSGAQRFVESVEKIGNPPRITRQIERRGRIIAIHLSRTEGE